MGWFRDREGNSITEQPDTRYTGSDYRGLSRKSAVALAVAALGLPVLGAILYSALAPKINHLIEIELGSWHLLEQYDPTRSSPVLQTHDLHRSLGPDLVFIACYGTGLVLGCLLATRMAWTRISGIIARLGIAVAAVVIVADVVEDVFLYLGDPTRTWCFDVAAAASAIKWSAAVPAAAIALAGVGLTLARVVGNRSGKFTDEAKGKDKLLAADVRAPARGVPATHAQTPAQAADVPATDVPATDARAQRWRRAYDVPDIDASLADPSRIGICLSGGGVRSASVALGALQALRPKVLLAKYLISVSGGGYTSGAFIQALAAPSPAEQPVAPDQFVRDPRTVYAPGSAEEDHIRRHSSYLADSPGRIVLALGLLARSLLGTLFLIFGTAITLGVLTGVYYRYVPITPLTGVTVPAGDSSSVPFPRFSHPALFGSAAIAALALLCWVLGVVMRPFVDGSVWGWVSERCIGISGPATVLAGVVALFVVGLPTLTWGCTWLYTKMGHGPVVSVGGPLLSVLLSYFASLGSILWKHKSKIALPSGSADTGKPKKSVTAAVPHPLLQLLIVIVVLALLFVSWLLVFGVAASTRASTGSVITASIIGGIWLFIAALIDETALSLHPFYRARIAAAFAVRVLERPDRSQYARPYDPDLATPLPQYGTYDKPDEYPQVVFAATANVVDDDWTAPGLRAVSYVMTADWIGGPDVGWLKTQDAIDACPVHLKKDLTVQAAVAISGAAFASAMGRASAWYETLLAISGARLGSWLPHPDYIRRRKEAIAANDWTLPGLPRVRRFPYLAREILGIHPYNERLLHVTDGGHYENLGLVEALRRRCNEIYVIDASGDAPPTASTFAEAIRLAGDELGVTITPQQPWHIEPGSGEPIQPENPLSALNARLSKTAVITATITYPQQSGLPEGQRTGYLVFAKARLWPQLPYEVLSYAAKHDIFPHDSTGDQWFEEGQFSQYKRLGHLMGDQASTTADPTT